MSIVVTCPRCKTNTALHDSLAGKIGKCRKCGAAIGVPNKPQTTPTPSKPRPQKQQQVIQPSVLNCWHCGMQLPHGGQVCPFCNAGRNTPELVRVLGIIVVIGIISFGGIWLFYSTDSSSSALPPISPITFSEFDSKFSEYSNTTDAQKQQLIDQYKGKRVRWEGIIDNVDDDCVFVQHKATTLTSDVILRVMESDKPKLASLNKGDLLTYEGTIADFGTLLSHDLHDGHIVSTKSLTAEERGTWLMQSETDALKPIADDANR